jgi:hypothetical protein
MKNKIKVTMKKTANGAEFKVTESQPQHSPTPWKVVDDKFKGELRIVDSEGITVAIPFRDNAAYIVLAVNAYDDLINFVQDVIDGNMEYEKLQLNALAIRAKAKGIS